jgi:hypothetical protein
MADTFYGIFCLAAIVVWFGLLACGMVLGVSRGGGLAFLTSLILFLAGGELGGTQRVVISSVLFVPLILWLCLGLVRRWPLKLRRGVLPGEKGTEGIDFTRTAVYEDFVVAGDEAKKHWKYQLLAAAVCFVLALTATLAGVIRLFGAK